MHMVAIYGTTVVIVAISWFSLDAASKSDYVTPLAVYLVAFDNTALAGVYEPVMGSVATVRRHYVINV
jgi:hypothetical protein